MGSLHYTIGGLVVGWGEGDLGGQMVSGRESRSAAVPISIRHRQGIGRPTGTALNDIESDISILSSDGDYWSA